MHTTLNNIRLMGPCKKGWYTLLTNLGKTKGDDEPIDFVTILESNGLGDALWCIRVLDKEYFLHARELACNISECIMPDNVHYRALHYLDTTRHLVSVSAPSSKFEELETSMRIEQFELDFSSVEQWIVWNTILEAVKIYPASNIFRVVSARHLSVKQLLAVENVFRKWLESVNSNRS